MDTLASNLREWVKMPLRQARGVRSALRYYGAARYCPVCGKSSNRFNPFGIVPRENAQCPRCGSLERHRLTWLFLERETNLFDGGTRNMLHVAPEACFESILKKRLAGNYLTADLFNPRAMVRMDICDIQYPADAFDVICCSHVLEHVPDDRRAMREFFRILKKDGWAILNVPITSDKTFEDPTIVDPEQRLELFGQEDHVRRYGPDYIDRLRDSGFTVRVVTASDLVDSDQAARMGLTQACGEIYHCTK